MCNLAGSTWRPPGPLVWSLGPGGKRRARHRRDPGVRFGRAIGGSVAAACVLVAPSFAGAGPSGPVVTQQISTRVGDSVAGGASLVYRYPRGRLQRDFEPPAWGEASARPCQARL